MLAGYQAEKPIVLKLGLDEKSLQAESLALAAFAGCGVINLLAHSNDFL